MQNPIDCIGGIDSHTQAKAAEPNGRRGLAAAVGMPGDREGRPYGHVDNPRLRPQGGFGMRPENAPALKG
ncbi:MAG: hypothetical protein IH624_17915 [Phycisphaerae bacterium]|nr:hypothetical protein [Phycisphaerae bacterium]